MKKIILICFFIFLAIGIVSCESLKSSEDKVNSFLDDIYSERYIEMNVLIEAEYLDNRDNTEDDFGVWPDTFTEYVISFDTKDVYFSRVYLDYPDYMLDSKSIVYINYDEGMTSYTLDENGEVLSESNLSVSGVNDSELVDGLIEGNIPDFHVSDELGFNFVSEDTFGYILSYNQMETYYLSVASDMYSSMSLGFYEESTYTLSYTYSSDLLEIEILAYYEDEELTQNFKITYEISFPSSIEKIAV